MQKERETRAPKPKVGVIRKGSTDTGNHLKSLTIKMYFTYINRKFSYTLD